MRRLYAMLAATIVACGFLAASASSAAAQGSRTPLIGLLSPAGPNTGWFAEGFRQGMKELGYIEGQNIRIEFRWAHGQFERLPSLAAELVQLNVDVIVAGVTQASLAAKGETPTIPIVMAGVGDPVGVGLVASLARPGGNVTGVSAQLVDVNEKRLGLMREIVPQAKRFALLGPDNDGVRAVLKRLQAVAPSLGVEVRLVEASDAATIERAFARLPAEGVDALLVAAALVQHNRQLIGLAERHRVPASYIQKEALEAGALLVFGPDTTAYYRRAAEYMHRILSGAKPAELPVEQPRAFWVGVNQRTAKALGLSVPASVLLSADRVIE